MDQVEKHITLTSKMNSQSQVDQEGPMSAADLMQNQLKVALIAKLRLEGDQEINKKLEDNSEVALLEARYLLIKRQREYKRRQQYVWVVFACGSIVSLIFAILLPAIIFFATKSSTYGRAHLD